MKRTCPSCSTHLSPIAVECPICGLSFSHRVLPRPLLFQVSILHPALPRNGADRKEPQAIVSPAIGRIQPVSVFSSNADTPSGELPSMDILPSTPQLELTLGSSFLPLVQLEISEFLLLLGVNALVAGLSLFLLDASPGNYFRVAWPLMLPFHLLLSWGLFLIPILLTGQSPLMPVWNLFLEEEAPERRIAFSILHLLSVLFFPLSFFHMLFSREHLTLAESLSGQEIMSDAWGR